MLKKMSISIKLVLVLAVIIFVLFFVLGLILTSMTGSAFRKAQEVNFNDNMAALVETLSAVDAEVNGSLMRGIDGLKSFIVNDYKIDTEKTVKSGNYELPSLYADGKLINGDTGQIDKFVKVFGVEVTFFIRSGDDFVRAATSIKSGNGARVVGTVLDRGGKAYAATVRGDMYIGTATILGSDYLTGYVPLKINGRVDVIMFVGVPFEKLLQERLQRFRELKFGESGYLVIMNGTPDNTRGEYVMHPARQGTNALSEKDGNGIEYYKQMLDKKNGTDTFLLNIGGKTQDTVAHYVYYSNWNWLIVAFIPSSELFADSYAITRMISLIMFVIAIVIILASAIAIRRVVILPMHHFIDLARNLSVGDGDLTLRIPIKNNDELGQLAVAFNAFIENISRIIVDVKSSSEEVASGSTELSSTVEELSVTFRSQTEHIAEIAENMKSAATAAHHAAAELSENRNVLKDSRDNTEKGQSQLTIVKGRVNDIKLQTAELATVISSLSGQVSSIGSILGVINDIADQTNLLALNAAIEAARAGEAGRGFAVVADEVRKLAERTQRSTGEIENIVMSLRGESAKASENMERAAKVVERGVDEISRVTEGFGLVVASVTKVEKGTESLAARSHEQEKTIRSIEQYTETVASGLNQSNIAVQEISKTVDSLQETADRVKTLVGRFKA